MLNILIAEDDAKARDCFAQFLRLKGHSVREATDGAEAVAVASESPFDLVLMDVKMPRLDGISAFRQIRARFPNTPIVLVTTYTINEALERTLQEGAVVCLQKPLLFKDLEALLDQVATHGHL